MQHAETITDDPFEAGWFGRETPEQDRARARKSAAALLMDTVGLRAPPAVVTQILGISQDPDATFAQLRRAVEQDATLSAQIVRKANGALYATRVPCNTLDQAVMRLGFSKVRSVALGLVSMGAFEAESAETRAIRRHSARVAALSEVLGKATRSGNVPGLFLCGLVHDIGKLALTEAGCLDYADADSTRREVPGGTLAFERDRLGFDHATLGGVMLEKWCFPHELAQVVELHHDAAAALEGGVDVASDAVVLRLADAIEHAMTAGAPAPWDRAAMTAEARVLELSADVLAAMWPKLETCAAEASSIFG